MKNKECNVIRDLLPNYMERLTSNNTNTYIENHIKECSQCSSILENMQIKYNIKNEDKKSKDFVDFAKKYNRKFKSLKFIVISIILLTISIFVISTARKYIILSNCYEKLYHVREANNYHYRIDSYSEDGIRSQEIYRKDNKYMYVCSFYNKNTHEAIYPQNPILYYDGQKGYWYSEWHNIKFYSTIDYNKFETLLMPEKVEASKILLQSIFSKINTETMNGKECYRIIPSKIVDLEKFNLSNDIYYIDKNTGIPLRNIPTDTKNNLSKYNWIGETSIEFDTVTDEKLTIPNIQDYRAEEDVRELLEKMPDEMDIK